MHYADISTYGFIPYYASVYTQTHASVEDSEPTGLKWILPRLVCIISSMRRIVLV